MKPILFAVALMMGAYLAKGIHSDRCLDLESRIQTVGDGYAFASEVCDEYGHPDCEAFKRLRCEDTYSPAD
jgi:hypothetical protein